MPGMFIGIFKMKKPAYFYSPIKLGSFVVFYSDPFIIIKGKFSQCVRWPVLPSRGVRGVREGLLLLLNRCSNLFKNPPLLPSYFCPTVPQWNSPVKHKFFCLTIQVNTKITQPLKLEFISGRCRFQAWFQLAVFQYF